MRRGPGGTIALAAAVASSSLAVTIALATGAGAAERVTVAVLYFDNNSPNRAYDVLQKGLADMLVTDLSHCELYREIKAQAARASVGTSNVVDGLMRTAGNACGESLPEMNR